MNKSEPTSFTLVEPHRTGLSRYGELAGDLRARILRGQWAPGQALSAESELARTYGVALGTMRQAIGLLVDEGLLERRHGRGTFVRAGLGGASLLRFFRFRHTDSTQPPTSRILSCKRQTAVPDAAALALGLAPGEPVLAVDRVRSIAGQPCLLETIFLPLPAFEPLASSDPSSWGDLLYPEYQRRCGITVHEAQDHLSFDTLSALQARRLGLAKGHPCVRVRRLARDLAGHCVEFRLTVGDAFDFEYTATVR